MGSSNGVTRGQLRPYFSGRTPPFILVGTLIILIIFGFSYWSLNSQYNDLQVELHEFQDQLRSAAQKRLENEKLSRSLQEQLVSLQDTSSKCRTALEKKDEEITEISQQLRDDATKASSQVDEIRMTLEKCEEEKSKKEEECHKQQDHTKQLETENSELKKDQAMLKEKIILLESAQKQVNAQQHIAVTNTQLPEKVNPVVPVPSQDDKPKQRIEENDTHAENKNAEPTPGNPDIGIPPGNDGGNDVQENANVKSKDTPPAQMNMVNNDDGKSTNDVQSKLQEEPKNIIDVPQHL